MIDAGGDRRFRLEVAVCGVSLRSKQLATTLGRDSARPVHCHSQVPAATTQWQPRPPSRGPWLSRRHRARTDNLS
jgi:hypothetical protein